MNMNEFIKEIREVAFEQLSPQAQEFLHELEEKNGTKEPFTEKGKTILKCMQENHEQYLNVFSAKQIGELLFMAPRSVSGSMKKLILEGYVEKKSSNPVTYGITEVGLSAQLDA